MTQNWLGYTAEFTTVATAVLALVIIPLKRRAQATWKTIVAAAATVQKELTNNGGSSIKDSLDQLGRDVARLDDNLMSNTALTRAIASVEQSAVLFHRDGAGGQVWANTKWSKLTGLTLEESIGWGWINGIHPDDREAAEAAWTGALLQRRIFLDSYRYRNVQTGVCVRVQVRAEPLINRLSGRPVAWIGTAMPVPAVPAGLLAGEPVAP